MRTLVASVLFCGIGWAQTRSDAQDAFALAERRAPVAQECLRRAHAVLEGWWAIRDPATGMLPRTTKQYVWAPGDNAADMYPFLVLTARYTAPERMDELLALLRAEVSMTTRLDGLPDWYLIREQRFQHAKADIHRIIFASTEYAKDGLNPLIELDGPDPWSARMRQLLDGVMLHAPVDSDFGKLPSNSTEVNGEMLQVLTRFYFLTGEIRYLEFAERIADAYSLEVLPRGGWLPAHRWDFGAHKVLNDVLSLNDHGNEIIGGLAELYAAVKELGRESSARYEPALRRMFDTLLERGRNADGLWYSRLQASTAEPLSTTVPDTWGYALAGMLNFGLVTGQARYVDAARFALQHIDQERYLDWGGADSFADSIEGALLLLQHLPEAAGYHWLERILPAFFGKQELPSSDGTGTGIVEGWYGDGNYARTALMVALCYTRGTSMQPWNSGLELGAADLDKDLFLSLSSAQDWSGRLYFDHARHAKHFRLPHDLPRLNSFPEWYTVEAALLYRVAFADPGNPQKSQSSLVLGAELLAGLPVQLKAGQPLHLTVTPVGLPPYGREPEPTDPFEMLDKAGGDPVLIDQIDLVGAESYAGEHYRWTGRTPIEWNAQSTATPVDSTLWLRWGAKNDMRRARVIIAGHAQTVEFGGYDGYAWLAMDVPREWWLDGQLDIRIEALESGAAFLAGMRLRRLSVEPEANAVTHWVEAEDFDGDWRLQKNIPGYSGTGFRVSNADGVASATLQKVLDLPAGRYQIWARGYAGDEQDRRFALSVADRRFPPTHGHSATQFSQAISSSQSSATGNFDWQLAGHLQWSGGSARIQIHDAGAGFEVADCVLLTSDLAFDPGAKQRIRQAAINLPLPTQSVDDLIEQCAASAERAHDQIAGHQKTQADWIEEKQRLQARLADALGLAPFPPRTDLNIRPMGTLQRDGYRIEKVVFDSRPGFPVTANVYVPDGVGPFPIVLNPVGHWGESKAEPVVQARCIGLAKQGYLALTYDPFGQGERNVVGNGHSEYFRSILVGWNNMSFMVWDTMRALDYLLQRNDVDGSRVACTGASGGGLNTLYAAAMDPRITVAVPVVYLTRLREFLETKITHCPCSHVNGLASFMDMGDVAGLIAPRPLLAITASRDTSFTPVGAKAAIDQAMGAYRVMHAEQNLALREFDAPHDYNQAMRESMYGWLAAAMMGAQSTDPVAEPTLAIESDPSVLNCYPSGKIPASSQTVHTLSKYRAKELWTTTPSKLETLDHPWNLADVTPAQLLQPIPIDPGPARLRSTAGVNLEDQLLLFECADGTLVKGWRHRVANKNSPRVIVIGKDPAATQFLKMAAISAGAEWIYLSVPQPFGNRNSHLTITDSLLLGDSVLALQSRTLTAALQALYRKGESAGPTLCYADGPIAALALHSTQEFWPIADAFLTLGDPLDWQESFKKTGPSAEFSAWDLYKIFSGRPQPAGKYIPHYRVDSTTAQKTLRLWIEQNQ
jgi:dienelactone hydrolase